MYGTTGALSRPSQIRERASSRDRSCIARRSHAKALGRAKSRVPVTDALLDQEVIEQPHDRDPNLKRRVRQPSTGVERDHICAMTAGPLPQIADVPGNVGPAGVDHVDAGSLAEPQVVDQRAGVRVDRPRRATKIAEQPQPPDCQLTRTQSEATLKPPGRRRRQSARATSTGSSQGVPGAMIGQRRQASCGL